MVTKNINLEKFRGPRSSVFTGRSQGEQARKELELNELDKDDNIIVRLIIPKSTSSFNPSFYLGLLYESLRRLGLSKFDNKYVFEIEDESDNVASVLKLNLDDGKRNAINMFKGKAGLERFLKND